MKILVSAIIPVYNSEQFLEECIESLRNQTLKEIEMIFINDGSTDNSLEILNKYEKIDSRIKVINQNNSGPSVARNIGIEVATGEYISFIDSDDWIDKDMYKMMYEVARDNNSDSIICDMKMVDKEKELYIKGITYSKYKYNRNEIEDKIFKELLSNSQFNSMANKIYRTSIIKENNIRLDKNIYYAEDWLFNMEFFKISKNIFYINECFYYYRRGHESSSSSYKQDTFEKVGIWIYKMRKKYASELGMNPYLAVDDLFKVTVHCIISELRRLDISFKKKLKNVSKIINSKECIEVIDNIDKSTLKSKEKFIYYSIKYKLIFALQIYVLAGKIKEKFYIRRSKNESSAN